MSAGSKRWHLLDNKPGSCQEKSCMPTEGAWTFLHRCDRKKRKRREEEEEESKGRKEGGREVKQKRREKNEGILEFFSSPKVSRGYFRSGAPDLT